METISVLIPTYNVAKWVQESILSILNQTYTALEVIIVDDCSTDGTYAILETIAKSDSRVKLYRNDTNKKIVYTLNFALNQATGKYIARHDGDDVALPTRFQSQIEFLQSKNLDLVGTQMIPIDEYGDQIGPESTLPIGIDIIKKTAKYSSPITHIWVAKKNVYDRLEGYREIPYAEDYDFILRALDEGFICDNTHAALMKIRHRSGNTSDVASLAQRKGALYALKLHKQRMSSGYDDYDIKTSEKLYFSHSAVSYFHRISTQLLKRAYNSDGKALLIFYSLASCMLSYYNLQYLYSRFKTKRILKNEKNSNSN